MSDDEPIRNVDYCHRLDQIVIAWRFKYPYAPDATYQEIRDNFKDALAGFWGCHRSMFRFLEIEYFVMEFPPDVDLSETTRLDGFETYSAEGVEESITDDQAINMAQLKPILDPPNNVVIRIGATTSAVKVHLAEGEVWVDNREPPPDYEEHEYGAYADHTWYWPPIQVQIVMADGEDPPHHFVEVHPKSRIWFQEDEIGVKNRQMLQELLDCIYQQTEPDEVELMQDWVTEQELRDKGFVELLPENIGR